MTALPAPGFIPVLLRGEGAAIEPRPGWFVRQPPLDLPARIGRLLWGFASGDGTAGVSSLAPAAVFYSALRDLVDTLSVAGVTEPVDVVVDVLSDRRLAPFLEPVWPDAIIGEASDLATIADTVTADRAPRPATVAPTPSDPLRDRVVIVLGAARSGTTWLHRMLCAHPDIAGTETGETWLFPDIAPLWADDLRAAVGDETLERGLREFCDVLLDSMRERLKPAATHVCEKTPATVWRLPMLAAVYPDAYYVHVVRDGRDAVVSMVESGFMDGDLAAAARTWVDAVSRARGGSAELPKFREVRYEDLLADPSGGVTALWEWIGLTALADAEAALQERVTQRITPLEPVGDIGTGKWQTLDRKQRRELETIAGPLLAELGYTGRAR